MEFYYYNRHDGDTVIPLVEMKLPFDTITVLLKGEMIYYVNGERIELHDGDIICLKKGMVRTREEVRNSHYVSYNFFGENCNFLPVLSQGLLSNAARHIVFAYDETRKTTYDLSDFRLISLFRALMEELRYQVKLKKENELVKRIKKYVHEHLSEKITLTDISKNVFFSIPYIEKIFKEETGTSIVRYLIDQRVLLAKTLLLDATSDLKTIAQKCGFCDYNFFSRTFTKNVGFSPLAYRKDHRLHTR